MSPREKEDPVPVAFRGVLEGSIAPAILLKLCCSRSAETVKNHSPIFFSVWARHWFTNLFPF